LSLRHNGSTVRLALIAVLLMPAQAPAQAILDPSRIKDILPLLEPAPTDGPLRCDVTPIKPQLNYSFRFQAGYTVSVPMSQYQGSGHSLAILLAITPDSSRQPVYLGNRLKLPEVPKTKAEMSLGGAYLLGEGGYAIKWVMSDETGRVCRKSWHVDVKLGHSEHDVQLTIPAGAVSDLSGRGLRRARPPADDVAPLRLTVLMHAAPMSPRRTHMRPNDTMTLVSSLSSLLEHVPTTSVRLVVFNLDQQKELYRRDGFTLRSLNQVFSSVNDIELGLVDVQVLSNRRGHLDLITDMVNQELRSQPPSDAVVFLGPMARFEDKVPRQAFEKTVSALPRFFYFQVRPFFRGGRGMPPGPAASVLPDSINSAISRLNGKVVVIHSPGDLAKAISRLEHSN
jgi:hypothetical protein